MAEQSGIAFVTPRLRVEPWDLDRERRLDAVLQIMSATVTAALPPPWRGDYDTDRARLWIADRDAEGPTLLVRDRVTDSVHGLVVLYCETAVDWRLGYMLAEASWGQGFASELVRGLVGWASQNGIQSVTGGVAHDNLASIRVLEKAGFSALSGSAGEHERVYRWVCES